MAATEIIWPTTATPGRNFGEGQGDLLNAYAVKEGEVVRIRRAPGLRRYLEHVNIARVARGMHAMPDRLFHVWNGHVSSTLPDGTEQPITGGLPGSDRVTIANNLRASPAPDVVVVSDVGAFVIDMDTNTVAAYPDLELGSVISVDYYAGYFFFARANGDIVASELQSTDIEPLSFARAEYSVDGLFRVKSNGSNLLAMGDKTIEVFVDQGASPFPAVRQTALDVGLIGKWAVAGGANEWEHGVLWIASDHSVRHLIGLQPVVVSSDDVANDIYEARAFAGEMTANVYTFGPNAIFSITCAPAGWTWEYNVTNKTWHRRASYNMDHWRAQNSVNWRGQWVAQDRLVTGFIFDIDQNTHGEDTERLIARIDSMPLKQFPANIRIPSVDIDCTVALGRIGVPSPFQTDPVVMVSWSHDGGAHWSNPLARSLGAVGRYASKVTVNSLGRSTHQGVRIRLEIVDPVPFALTSAISTRTRPSRPRQVGV